jgi:hypothetical protein
MLLLFGAWPLLFDVSLQEEGLPAMSVGGSSLFVLITFATLPMTRSKI